MTLLRHSILATRLLHAAAFVFFAAVSQAWAGTVAVQVTDPAGHPLADAAVYAEPAAAQALPRTTKKVEIEQKGRKFLPLVTVVQAGTNISFPNNDSVRHHVYSFSPAKTFDIKLYSGESNPILFDKAGTVVVGCNIHDRMVAYIHVVPTPYFVKTDAAGKARLEGLPHGRYVLKAWHYGLPPTASLPEQPIAVADAELSASFKLNAQAAPAN